MALRISRMYQKRVFASIKSEFNIIIIVHLSTMFQLLLLLILNFYTECKRQYSTTIRHKLQFLLFPIHKTSGSHSVEPMTESHPWNCFTFGLWPSFYGWGTATHWQSTNTNKQADDACFGSASGAAKRTQLEIISCFCITIV